MNGGVILERKSSMNEMKKKIFVVDDHPIIREGLQKLISKQDDIAICGDAEDAYRALAQMETKNYSRLNKIRYITCRLEIL